jgi:hypothetical protein
MQHGALLALAAAIALSACERQIPAADQLPLPPPDPPSAATQAQPDIDATGMMPCSLGQPSLEHSCAWEVTRTRPGEVATIAVDPPEGGRTILSYDRGAFSSPQGQVQARRDGDVWLVSVAERQFFRFSDAVIAGD